MNKSTCIKKRYILGCVIGGAAAVYGLIAMAAGRTFLPGLSGGELALGGRGGLVLAVAYLSGGIFLIFRLALEKHKKMRQWRHVFYAAENFLLLTFIAALIYVLVGVDAAQ